MTQLTTRTLIAFREVTRRLRRIPGAVFFLEPVRRRFARQARPIIVRYDRDLAIEVGLGEHMGSHVFWYGAYSRDILTTLDRQLRPGMVVIDVGANIGEISLAAAARVQPNGRVIAFEPSPRLAQQLRANVERNPGLDVEVIESALGSESGRATLFDASKSFDDGSRHGGVLSLFSSGRCDVPAGEAALGTLDAHVASLGLGRVDLIKIDVEGAELAVLKGAASLLARFHPVLIMEVQEETSRVAGYAQRDLLDFLVPLGYRFAIIESRGRLAPVTADTLRPFQNVLCMPTAR